MVRATKCSLSLKQLLCMTFVESHEYIRGVDGSW